MALFGFRKAINQGTWLLETFLMLNKEGVGKFSYGWQRPEPHFLNMFYECVKSIHGELAASETWKHPGRPLNKSTNIF
ncbi:MAG TPA: hypothetical protein DCG19_11205 [Cryomorphaceae bacterium]|nr:hypothetical protein [Owenweeksia sp.]HAD97964.1 hypothetical protein [Cryomorphaceae bacterium]HBF19107.1 hypothetical protein [Cryomorphaceae bacterium]